MVMIVDRNIESGKLAYSFFSSTIWRDTTEEQVEASKAPKFK